MLRRVAVLLLDHVGVMAGHVHRRPSEAGLLLRFGYHRVERSRMEVAQRVQVNIRSHTSVIAKSRAKAWLIESG